MMRVCLLLVLLAIPVEGNASLSLLQVQAQRKPSHRYHHIESAEDKLAEQWAEDWAEGNEPGGLEDLDLPPADEASTGEPLTPQSDLAPEAAAAPVTTIKDVAEEATLQPASEDPATSQAVADETGSSESQTATSETAATGTAASQADSPQPPPVVEPVAAPEFAQDLSGFDQAAFDVAKRQINQEGYEKVGAQRNTPLMEAYIKLVARANGGDVTDESQLKVMATHHTAEQGVETYEKLLAELKEATWTTVNKDIGDDEVALRAPLDQDGYAMVASKINTEQMIQFIGRVIEANAGVLQEADPLALFAKYHSGEKSSQNFDQLVRQLHKVSWVTGMEDLEVEGAATAPASVQEVAPLA